MSGWIPNRPQTTISPPSCTPSAPGTAKPALRAAMPRLSITKAAPMSGCWPMAVRANQTSIVPNAHANRCKAHACSRVRGLRCRRSNSSCRPVAPPNANVGNMPASLSASTSTNRIMPMRWARMKPPTPSAPLSSMPPTQGAHDRSASIAARTTKPATVNRNWVNASTVRSSTVPAAASTPRTPRWVRSRMPTRLPPSCATGSREFTASRIQRMRRKRDRLGVCNCREMRHANADI